MKDNDHQTQLHTLLRQLHHELRQVEQISDRDRALLDHLSQHVAETLTGADDQPTETVSDRLEAAMAELSTTHPTILGLLNQISAALGNMGI